MHARQLFRKIHEVKNLPPISSSLVNTLNSQQLAVLHHFKTGVLHFFGSWLTEQVSASSWQVSAATCKSDKVLIKELSSSFFAAHMDYICKLSRSANPAGTLAKVCAVSAIAFS